MAKKRMFNMLIVDSDAFLEMPLSTQALYFHLNMRADDDGFVNNPKTIAKNIGASTDDLKLLIAKRFLLTFESGVIVIKHWRMHNAIRKDRYDPTVYEEEFAMLSLKKNGSYTENADFGCQVVANRLPDGCQVVANRLPQVSIGKVRLGKDRLVSSIQETESTEDEIHTQISWEILTTTTYESLISRHSKEIVDEVIQRIKDNNYHGCLNEETIETWCVEAEQSAANKAQHSASNHEKKFGFTPRQYDMKSLEGEVLGSYGKCN